MSQKLLQFFDKKGEKQNGYFYDPETLIIYYKKSHAGRRIKFSTKKTVDQWTQARIEAGRLLGELLGNKRKPRTLIKDELVSWLKVKDAQDLDYDTRNNVKRAALQIGWFWAHKFPSDINADSVAEWCVWWAENKPSIQMENALKYFRNFCNYLNSKQVNGLPLLPAVPPIKDPNAKKIRAARKKKKEKILTHVEFASILKTAPDDVHRLAVLFPYYMALRITETLTLRFGHEIIKEGGEWLYRWSDGQNKADLEGFHTIHPAIVPLLEKRLSEVKALGTDNLFPQKFDVHAPLKEQQIDWQGWRDRAKASFHWTPHTLRHTCLSNLFNNPKNPQALICKLYRVSLAVAISVYVKPTKEGRELMREPFVFEERHENDQSI